MDNQAKDQLYGDLAYVSADRKELIENCRDSLNFFAAVAMPDVFVYDFPEIFLAVWAWLTKHALSKERVFPKLALGLPRGFAKTTLMKLFVAWCILFTERKFFLIVAATAEHANNIINDIMDILSHPNIKDIFGDWEMHKEKDKEDHVRFVFNGRNVIIKGIGTSGTPRGINVKNRRPDLILLDDAQTREEADSETISDKLYTWILGTLGKAKSSSGAVTIFVANMYPTPWSILKRLNKNPDWIKFITGGLIDGMKSIWEELRSAEELIAEYKADLAAGKPEIFAAEVLNDDTAARNTVIDFSRLPKFPYEFASVPVYKFILIDPAGYSKKSNATAIGQFSSYDSHIPVLEDLRVGIMSPGEQVRHALTLAMETGTYAIGVEAVAYQKSLLYWLNHFCEELGITGMHFFPVPVGKIDKNSSIARMFREYIAGELFIHPRVVPQVHNQMKMFNFARTDNVDDILDILKMARIAIDHEGPNLTPPDLLEAREEPGRLITTSFI